METEKTIDTGADRVVRLFLSTILEIPEGAGRDDDEVKGGHEEGGDPEEGESLEVDVLVDRFGVLERAIRILLC